MEKEQILSVIRTTALADRIKISLHAAEEAVAEEISRADILEAVTTATIIEDYPTWWLGPSCLLSGQTRAGRNLHLVCSYASMPVVIITIYEPRPPKWLSPVERGGKP